MLSIADTGIGMNQETLSHLFEPFFTTKEQGKGTGLGLPAVFGIVRQHSGSIQPCSQLGRGTTFEIYLPRLDGTAVEARSNVPSLASVSGEATILLAEDEEIVRTLTGAVLRKHGYTVLEAENGLQALSVCREHAGPIHLLVTDVIMPGMSGLALAERLVRCHPEAKVLYMSGHSDDTLEHHGLLGTDVAFIQKPFPPSALAKQVQEALSGSVTAVEGEPQPSYV
jgi:CheY-like chemotaxis protein